MLGRGLLIRVEQYTFSKSISFKHPQKVYNVIPGDFTQDGRLDLLVYGQSSKSGELSIQLYTARPQGGFSESKNSFIHALPLNGR